MRILYRMEDLSAAEIKKKIEEAKQKKKDIEKSLFFLSEQLKQVCIHPEESVVEVRYRRSQGEFHFYPEDEFHYKRTCKACGEMEEHVTTNNELPQFKKIKLYGAK